jgi:phosphate transport system permease protein
VSITALPVSPTAPAPRKLPTALRPREFRPLDAGILAGAAASSFALIWVLFYQVTLASGAFGFLAAWYVAFLAMYWFATGQVVNRSTATDRVMTVLLTTASVVLFGVVVFVLAWVAVKAVPYLRPNLFYKDQSHFVPAGKNALDTVGVFHAIIGTLEQVAIAALLGVPVAIATAVFLNEVGGRGTRMVRTVVTAMSGTPAVVAGVFIYSIFIVTGILHFSGLAASLALFVILLPLVTRTTEEVLRVVPSGLREASLALGAPEWRTTWSVVLPTARSGVITAVLLGIARAVGETAPLIFTAFGSQLVNANPLSNPQEALPLSIFSNVRLAQPVLTELAFVTAFILISIVLILFVLARILGRPRTGSRRRRGGSGEDVLARSFLPIPIEAPPTEPVPPVGGPPFDEGGRW